MLKKALYLIVALVVVLLVVAAFLPATYTVERSIVIAKPPSVVFPQVADLNQWLKWSPWPEMEPSAKNTITGPVGEVGMSWAWEGKELGVGSLTLHRVEKDRSVHSKLVIKEPMASEADDYMTLEPVENGTKLTWTNTGSLPYPVGRYFGLTIEGMLGPQYESGLQKLKALCESIEEPPAASEEAPTPTETKPEVTKST
jgi:hypothetical protein